MPSSLLFSFINTFNYVNHLPLLSPPLLYDAFLIHLFIHLNTLGSKKFLLDDSFLSQTLLIIQITYQPPLLLLNAFIIHLFVHLTTLGSKRFLLVECFHSQTHLILQTTYKHPNCFFAMHSLYIYSFTSIL
jgi:hypothetical protein